MDLLREPGAVAPAGDTSAGLTRRNARRPGAKRLREAIMRCSAMPAGNARAHVTGPSASSSSTRARTSSASFSRSERSMPRVSTGVADPHADRRRPDDRAPLPHRRRAPLNGHRHDRHLRFERHQKRAALERQQRARAAARALRETSGTNCLLSAMRRPVRWRPSTARGCARSIGTKPPI